MDQFIAELVKQYMYSPDQLQKNVTLEHMNTFVTAMKYSNDENVLQIIGALVATFINQNYQCIQEYNMINQSTWATIQRIQSDSGPVYHFLSSILANILFHFYEKLSPTEFKQQLETTLAIKPLMTFRILDTIIERFRPPHNLHKNSIVTMDSKHRSVKLMFYRHNLEVLLQLINSALDQELYAPYAVRLLSQLLDIEVVTDTKEKDWIKLRRAEVKNTRSLEAQLRTFNPLILEQDVVSNMLQNSNLEWSDPTRSDIKRLWSAIRDERLIRILLSKLNTDIYILLSKICKIFKKHFKTDPVSITLIQVIVTQIQATQITDVMAHFKLARRTIFAVNTPEWISFNIQLIQQLTTIEQILAGFKFLRSVCRFYSAYEYGFLSGLLMPIIDQFYTRQAAQLLPDSSYYKSIRYEIKVISVFVIQQYLYYFFDIINKATTLEQYQLALDYYQIGLFSSMKATSYQLDLISKLKYYNVTQFVYPIHVDSFTRFNYKQLYAQALQVGFNLVLQVEGATQKPNIFFYKLWKMLFDPEQCIKFEELITVDKEKLFDFSRIFNFERPIMVKSLDVLSKTKLRFQNGMAILNQIMVPISAFNSFTQFQIINDQDISSLYYSIKGILLNAQNDNLNSQDETQQLISGYQLAILEVLKYSPNLIISCSSILEEKAKCTYAPLMQLFHDQKLFPIFEQQLSQYQPLIQLTIKMIHGSNTLALRNEVVDSLIHWVHKLSQYVNNILKQRYEQLTKERQLTKQSKDIYIAYYKPLLSLFKLYNKFQFLNKCQTSLGHIKREIYIEVIQSLYLVIKEDIDCYIHKMSPLFDTCQWVLNFDVPRRMLSEDAKNLILEYINIGIKLHEKNTLMTSLKLATDMFSYDDIVTQFTSIKFIVEEALMTAFVFNLRVREVGVIYYKFLSVFPQEFQNTMISIGNYQVVNKSAEWPRIFNAIIATLHAQILKKVTQTGEKSFVDVFTQLQLFYNYHS